MSELITLPRRSFTEVHELVYLFHSWEFLLEEERVPEILRPLQEIPGHLAPVMTVALAQAQAQLESAQAGTEIALQFPATPELTEFMRWGAERLAEVRASVAAEELEPQWRRALELGEEFVRSALEQLEGVAAAE